jgi:hypothetical protein
MVQYAENFELFIKEPIPKNRSVSGYGNKLPTPYVLKFSGSKRWYRIYAICYSNIGSLYVIKNKEKLFVNEYQSLNLPPFSHIK